MNDPKSNSQGRLAFTPKLALDFASLMEKQAAPIYERMGIIFPVITSSTVNFLGRSQSASLLDIARALGISHQLAAQRIKMLLKLEIVSSHKDNVDKRKTNYELTTLGQVQNELLTDYLNKADGVFADLNNELDVDLFKLLEQVSQSFTSRTLLQRIFDETN